MAISLLPLLWELEQPLYMQQRFTYGLTPKELMTVTTTPRERDYSRPWHEYYAWKARLEEDIQPDIKKDEKKFEISLQMRHFAPEEISAKAADGFIKIEAVHQERRDDHGIVTRQFVRRYALPDGCNEDAVETRVSPDGVLTATAPVDGSSSRAIPILLQRQADLLEHYNTFRGEKEPEEKEAKQKEPEHKEPKKIAPEDEDSKEENSPPQTNEPEEEDPIVTEPQNENSNQKDPEEKEPQEKGDVEDQQ